MPKLVIQVAALGLPWELLTMTTPSLSRIAWPTLPAACKAGSDYAFQMPILTPHWLGNQVTSGPHLHNNEPRENGVVIS